MNKNLKSIIYLLLAFFIPIFTFFIAWNLLMPKSNYERVNEIEKKNFELSKKNFEANKNDYEKIVNCFINEKISIFEDCKALDYKLYLDKLKLISIYTSDLDEISNTWAITIKFWKLWKGMRDNTNWYLYANQGYNNWSYLINGSWDKYFIKYNKYSWINYKYTVINNNWLIYEILIIKKSLIHTWVMNRQ